MQKTFLTKLQQVESIANASKVRRFLYNPSKYISALFHRKFIYSKSKKEKIVEATLFYGKTMQIALPAATDIYLTGGKSHSSEIRLATFLIKNLQKDQSFLDIGAHFGYFTLLASELVADSGRVLAFEPTTKSFNLLSINAKPLKNVQYFQNAISNTEDSIVFYEFPNLYSEYNSSDVSQFEQEDWYKNAHPTKVEIKATTIDKLTEQEAFTPQIIKIDVEGAEYNVISGGINHFKNHTPIIVMEYLEPNRKNESHAKATALLLSMGYHSYIIENDGNLAQIIDIDSYLIKQKLESDNIVFKK